MTTNPPDVKSKCSCLTNLETPRGNHNVYSQYSQLGEPGVHRQDEACSVQPFHGTPHHQDTKGVAESEDSTAIFDLTAGEE